MTPLAKLAVTTVLATAAALPAVAQDAIVLDTITLTANREATELSRSGSSVSVLDADALKTQTGRNLTDTLAQLPGVAIARSGPLGTTASVYVRGASNEYVPTLIDGIDVSDPAAGQPYFDMGGFTAMGVSRVEVLRGSQSATYGSRAVGGVIDIQTLRPTEDGTRQHFAIEAGSYRTLMTSYGVAHRSGDTEMSATIGHVRSDGFSAKDEDDGNFEEDGFRSTRLSFYAAHTLQGGARIGINGLYEDSRNEFDDFGGDVTGTPGSETTDRESFGLRGFAEFSTGAVDHTVTATRYRIDRLSCQDNAAPTYTPGVIECDPFVGARSRLSYQAATDIGTTRAVAGLETERETAHGNGKTTTNSAFVETQTAVNDRFDVNASIRRDDHSRTGGFTSGRVAMVYRASEELLFRAAIGNGFRAPSLYELFGPYGQSSLRREESRSAEIGVERRWGEDSYLRATAFWLKAENLIGWNPDATSCGSGFGCYDQVDGTTRRKGVEIDGRHAFANGTALTMAYTYTDNGAYVEWADVPVHVLTLGVEHEFASGTRAGLSVHHVADRPRNLGDFTTVDLTVAQPLRGDAEAYIRVENLLDEDYQLVPSYGTSDRAVYAGLRASF